MPPPPDSKLPLTSIFVCATTAPADRPSASTTVENRAFILMVVLFFIVPHFCLIISGVLPPCHDEVDDSTERFRKQKFCCNQDLHAPRLATTTLRRAGWRGVRIRECGLRNASAEMD